MVIRWSHKTAAQNFSAFDRDHLITDHHITVITLFVLHNPQLHTGPRCSQHLLSPEKDFVA
jgi:hypothetical protein